MFLQILNFLLYHTPFFYLIQSVWRDEAFSFFMAKPNPFQIIINTANDFNPPLYYILLHFWMIITGKSDETLRILSLIPHLAGVFLIYLIAVRIFNKKFAFFVAAFTLLNPMLIYYAFEIRMYSWYVFFTIALLYFFHLKNWRWYTISAILGLYTHSFFPLIIMSFAVYLYLTKQFKRKIVVSTLKPILFFLPWIPVLVIQFIRSKGSWIYPVDINLIRSVLGNLFTNYEGTPGHLWPYTAILSMILITFFIMGYRKNRKTALLFLIPISLPLVLILSYSIVRQPLYVNRYLIFITVFEILAVSGGVWSIRSRILKMTTMVAFLAMIIFIDIYIPPYHKKTDFKTTFREINAASVGSDYTYTKTPIAFLESAYYFKNNGKVYVYNPDNITIPNYIGVTVVFPGISKSVFPPAPSKTYLIEDDATYSTVYNR